MQQEALGSTLLGVKNTYFFDGLRFGLAVGEGVSASCLGSARKAGSGFSACDTFLAAAMGNVYCPETRFLAAERYE